jgi:hypothetical protein
MLLRFFRTNGALVIVVIPIIGIILWLAPFLNESKIQLLSEQLRLPLYDAMFGFINEMQFIQKVTAFLLVISIAFLLVRLNTRFIIINNRTYLPALVYILIVSGIPDIQKLNPALVSTFIMLFIVEKILDSYRQESLYYGFFTAAFMLGVGCLLYPFLIYFLLTLWAGIILLRQFNWREWTFSILGFAIPFLFVFTYYFVLHDDPAFIYDQYTRFYSHSYDFRGYSLPVYIFVGILALLMLLASQFLMQAYSARKIISRRAYSLLLWLFINTIAVFFLIEQASVELIYIAALPLSFLLANYWVFIRAVFWGNLFLILLILSILFNQINYYYF